MSVGPSLASIEVWGITPDCLDFDTTVARVSDVISDGVDRVIVRENRLPWPERLALMERLLHIGIDTDRLLLRLGPEDPSPPDGWSVHLAEGRAAPPGVRPMRSGAAHSPETMRPDVDVVSASPVAAPTSKSSPLPPLGTDGLARFVRAASVPVLALGGIRVDNVDLALSTGVRGVAAIGSLFLTNPTARRKLVLAAANRRSRLAPRSA